MAPADNELPVVECYGHWFTSIGRRQWRVLMVYTVQEELRIRHVEHVFPDLVSTCLYVFVCAKTNYGSEIDETS